MKTLKTIMLLCMALFFIGCPIRSIYPLFTEKDLAFNPELVGIWADSGKSNIYYIQKGTGTNYELVVHDVGNAATLYTAQLGRLGDEWFLDTYNPAASSKEYQMVSTHIISRIRFNGDTLRFASLEASYIVEPEKGEKVNRIRYMVKKVLTLVHQKEKEIR